MRHTFAVGVLEPLRMYASRTSLRRQDCDENSRAEPPNRGDMRIGALNRAAILNTIKLLGKAAEREAQEYVSMLIEK